MNINDKCPKFETCAFTHYYRNGLEGGDKTYIEKIQNICNNKEKSKNCKRLKK